MKLLLLFAFVGLAGASAGASELIYQPINPTFGGNPLNATQLQGVASAQKPSQPTPASSATSTQQSASQQFMQMLQSQLYSSLANSVANAITGQNAQVTGTIKLNNMQLTWNTVGGETNITMTDYTTGQITQISVPQVTSTAAP
jgi:curli production assembly/transport component CsgF